jgi:hypothetical protein
MFVKDELPQLMWVVARLFGLRRGTPPKVARPVTADLSTHIPSQIAKEFGWVPRLAKVEPGE